MKLPSFQLACAVLIATSVAACGDAATTSKVAPSGAKDPTEPTKGTDDDGDVEPTTTTPSADDADAATPPGKNVIDGEGEPLTSELAIDPLGGGCVGPFDCVLPNPSGSDRNRVVNPKTGTQLWPIGAKTPIVDGAGGSRGTVTASSVKINYGQRKTIGKDAYVYAFAVGTTNGTASSWVPESAIGDPLTSMTTVVARDPGKGDYEEMFTITGGDPAKYGDAKVVPKSTSDNEAATDYLLRNGSVVNALYALPGNGGVSNDTYPAKASVVFKRAKGVASVFIYLYTKGTDTVIGTQRFVYGHVGDRYSWIARDALDPPAPNAGPAMTFCCAKCAGRTAAHRVPDASDCTTSATTYCATGTRGAYESSSIGACEP